MQISEVRVAALKGVRDHSKVIRRNLRYDVVLILVMYEYVKIYQSIQFKYVKFTVY